MIALPCVLLPCPVTLSIEEPIQKSCHSFHTVSISTLAKFGFPKVSTIVSKAPLSLINKSGTLLVSFHSSPGGSNVTFPTQVKILNGFMFKYLLA